MTIVVFAGPSIFGIDPAATAPLDLRPPAAAGDLLKAARDGATIIGLIDGVFESAPSTWHKEILAALDRGVAIFGAASMGALRAAECRQFGMVGIGQVFQDYAANRRVADADVAVIHGPAELRYRPLTEALVDVEASLQFLAHQGFVEPVEIEALWLAARKLHFKVRTWRTIFDHAGLVPHRRDTLAQLIRAHAVSQKREDAYALLHHLGSSRATAAAGAWRSAEPFSNSLFFVELERRVANGQAASGAPGPAL
jgi:hypothetical protein